MISRYQKRYSINFPRHLAICEFNYRRLQRLMPGVDNGEDNCCWQYGVGQHPDEMTLKITVTDQAPYTTAVRISVRSRWQQALGWNSYPAATQDATLYSLDVRLYHDATVAEVTAWEGHRRIQPRHEYPNRSMYQRDEKAQINQFLGELLEYCLQNGRVMRDIMSAVE